MNKFVLLSLFLFSTLLNADSSKVEFSGGWIKQLPPVVPMRAGYLQIHNKGKSAARITAFQSDTFERVEMHETMMADGMMKMQEMHELVIPAEGMVELKPGGKHLMLITPKTALELGDKIDLIATFDDEQSQQVSLVIKR